jgi:hypothetical protein
MIYVNGCSFTNGDELQDPTSTAWPILLGRKLNKFVTNDAISGGTNSRTLYRTIKNLSADYSLYIIAWTSTARYTFYKNDNNFETNFNPQLKNSLYGQEEFYYNWGKTLYTVWHNDLYALKLWLQQIIQLQSIFDQYKKNYIMINTMHNDLTNWLVTKTQVIDSVKSLINFDCMNDDQIFAEYNEIQYYISCINTEKFYKWNEFYIQSLCKEYTCGTHGHFLEEGHSHMTDIIYEHLCLK